MILMEAWFMMQSFAKKSFICYGDDAIRRGYSTRPDISPGKDIVGVPVFQEINHFQNAEIIERNTEKAAGNPIGGRCQSIEYDYVKEIYGNRKKKYNCGQHPGAIARPSSYVE
jgi:hypothetical protein